MNGMGHTTWLLVLMLEIKQYIDQGLAHVDIENHLTLFQFLLRRIQAKVQVVI